MDEREEYVGMRVNGEVKQVKVAAGEKLLETLRRYGYKSVKYGCGEGTCGACTVLVDGRPRLACLTFTRQVEGREITTVEGLGKFGALHPLQEAFLEEGAVQCGYCTPGMLLAAKALLDRVAEPSVEAIKRGLDGNKCRCTGYGAIIRAVQRAAAVMSGKAGVRGGWRGTRGDGGR
ncbi:MAG: (2Fe-2S)-binding protein [bacterium]|nr:(2Fe-2S)-binding protein [bacterium]